MDKRIMISKGEGTVLKNTGWGMCVQIGCNCVIGGDAFTFSGRDRKPSEGFVRLGNDVTIHDGVIINRGTTTDTIIGDGTRIDGRVFIGHDCKIGQDNTITAGCVFAGFVQTGRNCRFNPGAVVANRTQICDNVEIGINSTVLRNITEPGVYVGNPCRRIR